MWVVFPCSWNAPGVWSASFSGVYPTSVETHCPLANLRTKPGRLHILVNHFELLLNVFCTKKMSLWNKYFSGFWKRNHGIVSFQTIIVIYIILSMHFWCLIMILSVWQVYDNFGLHDGPALLPPGHTELHGGDWKLYVYIFNLLELDAMLGADHK